MYFEYIKEKLGRDVIFDDDEHQKGFIVYTVVENELFVHDIYVKPQFRKLGIGSILCSRLASIAHNREVKRIVAQCAVSSNDNNRSLMFCLKMGMQVIEANNDWIYLEDKLWAQRQYQRS